MKTYKVGAHKRKGKVVKAHTRTVKGAPKKSGAGSEFKNLKKGAHMSKSNGEDLTYKGFHPSHGYLAEDGKGRQHKIIGSISVGGIGKRFKTKLLGSSSRVITTPSGKKHKQAVKKFFRS